MFLLSITKSFSLNPKVVSIEIVIKLRKKSHKNWWL